MTINRKEKDIDVGSIVKSKGINLSSYHELYMVVFDTVTKDYKLLNIRTGALINASYRNLENLIQDYRLELYNDEIMLNK